ncbi:helix-turn-helix domain-containing protein [Rhodocytophaga aerolata]|uniref:Helix-turn-helix domain-containing protein n=1 Tax=Rhodocytophaga aerolata TaxID=455078 RepID=A0ABT8R0G6_9BACT|nr:helix-turn-helix domain-containing protein [Rhodocytophaga aerolata]MDO1445574.1 helix-turn-helix domain-containing protein [Rhodocytophaga aerolata]
MKHTVLAARIVALRKGKGMSQEQLAEKASINLRTLQRIESGETEPRGQTLRLLALALDCPLEELIDFTKEEDKEFLQLLNLSTLSFWVVPLGNIFIPLILWVMKKDKIKGAAELGRRILNFQIVWSVLTFGSLFILVFSTLLRLPGATPWTPIYGVMLAGVLYLLNSVLILIASVQIKKGTEKVYSIGIKIIR